jgi:hypothetical protein
MKEAYQFSSQMSRRKSGGPMSAKPKLSFDSEQKKAALDSTQVLALLEISGVEITWKCTTWSGEQWRRRKKQEGRPHHYTTWYHSRWLMRIWYEEGS